MIAMNNFEQFIQFGLEGFFYILTLFFVGFSLSIGYHWFSYGIHKTRILTMLVLYLVVSAVLFITMALALNAL